jgi:hypothetical protein
MQTGKIDNLGVKAMDDRRKHFRLAVNLPLDVVLPINAGRRYRRVSSNVSAGGVYFQGNPEDGIRAGQRIGVRIAVPKGVGRTSEDGHLEGDATVIRVDSIKSCADLSERVGVACEFTTPLRFN